VASASNAANRPKEHAMSLASRLKSGETLFTAWSSIPDALTVEFVAYQGLPSVTLDMQHGGHHEDSVVRSVGTILGAGSHPVVRIPVGRFDMASRALDFGAEAVIAPMVNSVAEAKAFAAAMKFPPLGERSWGPTFGLPRHRQGDPQAYLHGANAETLALAMIETRAALDALDGILGVEGIDGVFLGPSDFSIAWTNGAVLNPVLDDMMEMVGAVAKRANEAGKLAGIYVVDPGQVGRFTQMGYRLMALGSDVRYIALGAEAMIKAARHSME
jgi:4-hydroxy-2-oxoheptanedioate aldolase